MYPVTSVSLVPESQERKKEKRTDGTLESDFITSASK